jgi:hypothetical protein
VLVVLAGCGRLGFDAHPTDGNSARDTAADSSASTFYTDGFEGPTVDPLWMLDISSGSIAIDNTHVHGGASALHVKIVVGGAAVTNPRATLVRYEGLPITGTIDARTWMYVKSPVPATPFLQVINLADDPGNGISTGTRNGAIANNDYTDQNYAESTTPLPLDTWFCLRFEMPSGTTDPSRVFLGPNELTDITLAKTSAQPPPTHLYLGIEWVGSVTNHSAEAWLDDFAIGSAALPCN